MHIKLTSQEKGALEARHRKERDRRVADRIKAVLLSDEGWSITQIAQALRIHVETIRTHLREYEESQKLKPENGGSVSKLDDVQTQELIRHLESTTYMTARAICAHVYESYGITYSVQGMTSWLHIHKFSYKQPAPTPSKADPVKQEAFIEKYNRLMNTALEDEPILFGDGVHPSMATKISCGWIRKGVRKPILTTASRTRINLMGALDLERMTLSVCELETLSTATMGTFFDHIKARYPRAPKIHLILDRGSYNVSSETQKAARARDIELHFLPPYSPNLNPIERCWKIMNEYTRNNRFFTSAKDFREAILNFFNETWPSIAMQMVDRVNDNFQRINTAPSL